VVSIKQQVVKQIEELPDDCTFEDVQYRLYVAETIRRRLEMADREELICHEDAKKRFQKWLEK
jgi:hypothetical protein